jgi:peptidoglycan/xylan/chitin deacetylase (PgdA/CDA1 family)
MSRARVRNLTFHGVGEPPRPLAPGEAAVWLSGPRFLALLDAVRDHDDIRISFDDSNRSDVDIALPALLDRGMSATFFVLAGRLDEPDRLGAEDVRRLVTAGMGVGSHGLLHRDWRRLDERELTEELMASRRILESVAGTPVADASVPFGSYDRRVLTRARRDSGYARVFTSDGGTARADAWLQPRTSMTAATLPRDVGRAHAAPVDAARRSAKRLVKRWR